MNNARGRKTSGSHCGQDKKALRIRPTAHLSTYLRDPQVNKFEYVGEGALLDDCQVNNFELILERKGSLK